MALALYTTPPAKPLFHLFPYLIASPFLANSMSQNFKGKTIHEQNNSIIDRS